LQAETKTRMPNTEMPWSHRRDRIKRLQYMAQNRIDAPSEMPKRFTSDTGSTSLELK